MKSWAPVKVSISIVNQNVDDDLDLGPVNRVIEDYPYRFERVRAKSPTTITGRPVTLDASAGLAINTAQNFLTHTGANYQVAAGYTAIVSNLYFSVGVDQIDAEYIYADDAALSVNVVPISAMPSLLRSGSYGFEYDTFAIPAGKYFGIRNGPTGVLHYAVWLTVQEIQDTKPSLVEFGHHPEWPDFPMITTETPLNVRFRAAYIDVVGLAINTPTNVLYKGSPYQVSAGKTAIIDTREAAAEKVAHEPDALWIYADDSALTTNVQVLAWVSYQDEYRVVLAAPAGKYLGILNGGTNVINVQGDVDIYEV